MNIRSNLRSRSCTRFNKLRAGPASLAGHLRTTPKVGGTILALFMLASSAAQAQERP